MKITKLFACAFAALAITGPAMSKDIYKVALDGTFAPHAMPKLDGGVEGFNVDFAAALAEQMGVEFELTAAQWSGLLPGMQAGTYDFLVAPTTVTEERSENMLFSEGYLNTDFQFLIKAGSDPVDALEGFEGKTIAVNKGSAYDKWARGLESEIGWKVESYGTNTDAVQARTFRPRFCQCRGQYRIGMGRETKPATGTFVSLFNWSRFRHSFPQSQHRAAGQSRSGAGMPQNQRQTR